MQKKHSFGEKLELFFAGKGFYIVLFLCVAVIGASAWAILAGTGTHVESQPVTDVMEIPEEHISAVTIAPEAPAAHTEPEAEAPVIADTAEAPVPELQTVTAPEPAPAEEASQTVSQIQPLFVWPVNGEIEIPYAVDKLLYNRTMQDWRTHPGIDLAAELGTQVMAVSSGVVENIYDDDLYGTTVVIAHGNGLESIYANLAEMPTVNIGDSVAVGEVIGAVGDTALAETGEVTHLHLAMALNGSYVNPSDYLPYR